MGKAKAKAGNQTKGEPVTLGTDREYDVGRPNMHREVNETSDTEPALEQHVATVVGHAEMLAKNYQERVAREGEHVWINPLAPKDKQIHHKSKKACQTEIDTKYKMQAQQAKLTKQPKEKYTPQEIIIEPKRTLEDFMGPKAASMMRAAKEIAGSVQNLGSLAHQLSGRELTAGQLMAMQEVTAIARLGDLSDAQLKDCLHKATFGGKTKLAKAARRACATRGIPVLIQ